MRNRLILTLAALLLTGCSGISLRVLGDGPEPPANQPPDIEVVPMALDFGHIDVDCPSRTRELTVTNAGAGVLRIPSAELVGDILFSGSGLDDQLDPGESAVVTVLFEPGEPGAWTGELVIESNDPDEPTVLVPITGETVTQGNLEDTFTQNGQGAVDLLFVVDTAGSMGGHQARVADAAGDFLAWFVDVGLDYQVGVVTADVDCAGQNGTLQGTWITPSTQDPAAALAQALTLDAEDCGSPSGLLAMERALTEPNTSGVNAGFLRDDALLSVVFVSSAWDESPDGSQSYSSFLAGLKADPNMVTVSAIAGDRIDGCSATCEGAPVSAEGGDRYIDVQEAFPGTFVSLCDCDLGPGLSDAGWSSAGFESVFMLSQWPSSPDDVDVLVNGEPTSGWTYDSDANTVTFAPESVPPAFADIRIQYLASVDCD